MIKFTKMHGLGNDYVYMDAINQKIENREELAKRVSDRHFGIGSDGLILICESKIADFRMQMFNSDGTEAEMCGNGIRCVGKFVYDKGLTNKETVTIETLAGIKTLQLNVENGKVKTVKVDMGEPILEPEKIPVKSKENPVKNLELEVEDKKLKFTCVSMGNPHAITIVEDTSKFDVKKYGEELEVNKAFLRRTNVEFVQIIDRNTIRMRVWERGAGETLACGTGACATAVAAAITGRASRESDIVMDGGTLHIEWSEQDGHVYMTGPAAFSFEGEVALPEK